MLPTKHTLKPSPAMVAHMNELLDEALKETFPASDPIAVCTRVNRLSGEQPNREAGASSRAGGEAVLDD